MKAMILAAGRGERMRPLTDTTPKPLLHAGGKPLIVWHIERLVNAGVRDIIINHAWLGEQIEAALGSGARFGARLNYSAENPALETAGGIAKVLPFFQGQPFLVVNGDIWCDWDHNHAKACAQALREHNAQAWLLLVDNPAHHANGDFLLSTTQNQKTPFVIASVTRPEDHIHHPRAKRLTFSGIGVYQPELFTDIQPEKPTALAPLLRTAMAQGGVIGSHHNGNWMDIGTPARLNQLNQHLARQAQARYTSH